MLFFKSISLLLSPLLWAALGANFYIFGDLFFRYFMDNPWKYGFVVSFAVYSIGTFFILMAFFGHNIAVVSVVAILFNIIGYLIAAYFLFGDKIEIHEGVGIMLGIAAIVMIEGVK